MLMHRMTFPLTAQVSLDAAGALTDGPAEMGGEGGTQNTTAWDSGSILNLFFILQNEEKAKVWRGLRCCHQVFITI